MADNNELRIIIQSALDTSSKAIGNLNKQIDQISKQIKKLKIGIDIDKSVVQSIKDLNKYFSTFTQSLGQQSKVTDKVNASLNDTTKSVNQQTKAIKDATEAEKKWQIEQQKTSRITGRQTTTYGNSNDSSKQTVIGNKDGTIRDHFDTINPAKDLKEQEDLLNKMYEGRMKAEEKTRDFNNKWNEEQQKWIQKNADLERSELDKTQKVENQAYLNNKKRDEDYYANKKRLEAQIADLRRRFAGDVNVQTGLTGVENRLSSLKGKSNYKQIFADMDTDLKRVVSTADTATSHALNFSEALRTSFIKFPVWLVAGTIFVNATRFFTQGISYVAQLDQQLNQIAIVTGKTQQEVQALAKEYNNLGRSLSVGTKDIATAAVEFYRQGLSQEEVMNRVRVATEYAKISNLQFKDSAEILTATVNSMNIPIEKAADVFSTLGDLTATGADEIGKAFQKVGGTAGALNISFEKTASWIAILSSRTREGAETIGQSVKSILARVQTLKETGFDETDGTKINDVAKSLATVGIALTDQQGQFRNFGQVMDELGAKWNTLDSRQKAYLSTTVAGNFQSSRFLNLMEGYQDTLPLYEKALTAAGTAQQKFATYQQSTEAAVNRLKTSMESLWSNTFNSDGLRLIMDSFSGLIGVFDKLASSIGTLPTVVGLATASIMLFSKNGLTPLYTVLSTIPVKLSLLKLELRSLVATEGVATAATRIFTASMLGLTRAFLPLAIITGVTWALTELFSAFARGHDAVKQSTTANSDHVNSLKQQRSEMQKLQAEYASLQSVQQSEKLTTEQKQRLLDVQTELVDKYGVATNGILEEGKAYSTSNDLINQRVNALDAEIQKENELNKIKLRATDTKNNKAISDSIKDIADYSSQVDRLKTQLTELARLQQSGDKTVSNNIFGSKRKDRIFENVDAANTIKIDQAQEELLRRLNDFSGKLTTANVDLQGSLSERKNILKTELNNYISSLGDSGSKVTAQQQAFFDGLIDSIAVNGKDIDSQIKDIVTSFDQLQKTDFNKYVEEFSKANAAGDKTKMEQIRLDVIKLLEVFTKGKPDAQDFIDNVLNKFFTATGNASSQTNDFVLSMDKLPEAFSKATGNLKDLNQAIYDVSKGQSLSAETVAHLIALYPSMASEIKKTADGWTIEKGALEAHRQAAIQNSVDSIKAEAGITETVVNNLKARLEAYGIELDAIKTLDDARNAAANIPSDKMFSKFANEDRTALKGVQADAQSARKDLLNYGSAIDTINKLKGLASDPHFGVPVDKPKKEKAGPSLKDSLADPLQDQSLTKELINSYNAIFDARQKNIDSLDRQIKTAEKAKNEHLAYELTTEKIQEQTKSIDDLHTAQDKMSKLADQQRAKASQLGKQMGLSFNTDKWFDVGGNGSLQYQKTLQTLVDRSQAVHANVKLSTKERNKELDAINKQKKQIEDIFSTLQLTKQGWKGNSDEVVRLNDEIDAAKEKLANTRIDMAQGIIDTQNKISQTIIDSYQAQIDTLQKQWDAQATSEERSKRQLEISQLQNKLAIVQYGNITTISDELAKQLGLEQEKADAVQRQNDLIKQQQTLQNVQKEKNVKLFQNGEFQWVADPRKVREEQDKLTQMQDDITKSRKDQLDSLQNELKSKQEDYSNWERDQSRKSLIDSIQAQITAQQSQIDLRNKWFEDNKTAIGNNEFDINTIVSSSLDTLNGTYGSKWDAILSTLKDKLSAAKQMYEELSNTVSNSSSSSSASKGSGKSNQQIFLENLQKTGSKGDKQWATEQLKAKKYANGGLSTETGPAWLDGTPSKPELVLKPDDTKNFLDALKITDKLPDILSRLKTNFLSNFNVSTPDFSMLRPSGAMGGGMGDTHYHIAIDKVQTNDAKSFIQNLKLYAKNKN